MVWDTAMYCFSLLHVVILRIVLQFVKADVSPCHVNLSDRRHWSNFCHRVLYSCILSLHFSTSSLIEIHNELCNEVKRFTHCYSWDTNPQAKLSTCNTNMLHERERGGKGRKVGGSYCIVLFSYHCFTVVGGIGANSHKRAPPPPTAIIMVCASKLRLWRHRPICLKLKAALFVWICPYSPYLQCVPGEWGRS